MSSSFSSAETTGPDVPQERSDTVRMGIFAGIFSTALLATTLLVTWTWRRFTGFDSLAWIAVPLVLTLGMVPAIMLGFRLRHPVLGTAYKISAVSLGILNYLLFAALACWLVAGVAAVAGFPVDRPALAGVTYGMAVLIAGWGLANAMTLRVTQVTVALPGLPASWVGRRIAVVSDVHLGNVRGAGFVRRIVRRLNALAPDAVLLAGDMFDGAVVDTGAVVRPWKELSARHGVYFATGNHDEFSDRRPWLAALAAAGVRVLHNEKVVVDGLQIVGVHDGEAGEAATYREILQQAGIDRDRASILLTHQPSRLEIPEQAGISLQVSGHTHGGQFWPWTRVVARVHGRFGYGLNPFGQMLVLTSSGAGTWGPPLRVGTKSEIVLLTLARIQR